MKRGHSNIIDDRGNRIEPWPDLPHKARIPLIGGSTAASCKELPPLALDREEWERIGQVMGWIRTPRSRTRKNGQPT